MKLIFCLGLLGWAAGTHAQFSFSSPPSPPDPSAMLDIKSTTGGLLIPRLTNTDRNAIASPPAGLMIFNTTFSRFECYDGESWKRMLDNDYWVRNGNAIYTGNNVGIGTAGPSVALDVAFGDIKISRGDMKLQRYTGSISDIDFRYNSSTTNGLTQGLYFNVGGSARGYFNYRHYDAAGEDQFRFGISGEASAVLKSSGELAFNSVAAPTIQLRNSGVDKGFMQLSGDDFRIGVNSANDAGNLIFRLNGNNLVYMNSLGYMGIGVSQPTERLHVAGEIYTESSVTIGGKLVTDNINITNEVRKPSVTGTFNLVPIAYGYVAADGSITVATPNVSVSRTSTGVYEVTVAGLNSACTIIVNGGSIITAAYYADSRFRVISNKNVSEPYPTPERVNTSFYFIVFQP